MDELIRLPVVAEILGIKLKSTFKVLGRLKIVPVAINRNGHHYYSRAYVESVARNYDPSRVAENINPEWRKPLFPDRPRRQVMTQREKGHAIIGGCLKMLQRRAEL